MTTTSLRQLPLAGAHRALGARFAPFAGWEMPIQFAGIVEEHRAVRERAGVFDVSHMGRLYALGSDAGRLLRRAVTYKVDQLAPGEAHYALMCDDDGGILDDVFVYRLGGERFLLVNNAANADLGVERVRSLVDGLAARFDGHPTVMLALQGPQSPAVLSKVVDTEASRTLRKRRCLEIGYAGGTLFVSRTGYTGEDGFELVATVDAGAKLLEELISGGATPCGLGARDTLRLEAALPLYGNDIDTTTNPYEAGLGFAVSLDDGAEFAGRPALVRAKAARPARKLSCLRATERGVMRAGYVVLHEGQAASTVTSGGFSPMLNKSIGMAYLPIDLATEGTALEVDVRGKRLPVGVIKRPFYRRAREAN